MLNLKPSKLWYILLSINILYVRYTTCSITSYIGSFFGFGGQDTTTTTTTTPLPPAPININSPDHLPKESVQYVPVVYYIPTGNSNNHNTVASLKDLRNIPNYGTVNNINSNQHPYYPWYHIRNPVNIPSINNLVQQNNQLNTLNSNNVESINVFNTLNEGDDDQLPKQLQDLAKKLGYNDTRSLPSLSQLREYLELSSDQETIDFILDLASTDYGLNLIKSYIIEEVSGDYSNNNDKDYIIDDYNYNNFITTESNIMSLGHPDSIQNFNNKKGKYEGKHEGKSFNEKYVENSSRSTNKVRRENNPEDATKILDKNEVHATIKRGRVNLDILKKLISHPFQTGFFGTLKHWTGFLVKNEELENSDVPVAYGPKNEDDIQPEIVYSYVDEHNNPIKTFTDANGSPAHYIQYPDGKIYIINSDLINYYKNREKSNDHDRKNYQKNYDELIAQEKEDLVMREENPDSLHISNNKLIENKYEENNNEDIFMKTMKNEKGNTPNDSDKMDFLQNSFRSGFDDYPESDLEASPSSNKESTVSGLTSSPKVVNRGNIKFNTNAATLFLMNSSTESPIITTTVHKKQEIEKLETTTVFSQQNIPDNTHNEERSFKIDKPNVEEEELSIEKIQITQNTENQNNEQSSTTIQKSSSSNDESEDIDDQEPEETIIQHVVVKSPDEPFLDKFKSLDNDDIESDVDTTVEPDVGNTDEPDVSITDRIDIGITDEPDVEVTDEPEIRITPETEGYLTTMGLKERKDEIDEKFVYTSETPSTTTVKTTVLKPISKKDEWKPQRVSGTNSFATGHIYRAHPLQIVVPKMIVPTK